jgi:antitoxin (DNA-binding transcriptional repressor) of toxin-antitoxin stability system
MAVFTIHAAKTDLSRLIARAAAGEEIIILRGKTPVARLTAIAREPTKRRFGAYRGEFEVPKELFRSAAGGGASPVRGGGIRRRSSWARTRCWGG